MMQLATTRRFRRPELVLWRGGVAVACLALVWMVHDFRWDVVWRTAPFLLSGLEVSLILAAISVVVGLLLAIPLAAARLKGPWGVRHLAIAYIELIRAIPQLMVIFWVYFTYPAATGQTMSAWAAAIISLSLIASAYLAEVVRAGLLSVPVVQAESAIVSGLSPLQAFVYVLLPQAIRNMVPALVAHFVMIFKVTSLVYVIGMIDFFRATIIINNRDLAPYALYTNMAVVYFFCCYGLSFLVRSLDPSYTLNS